MFRNLLEENIWIYITDIFCHKYPILWRLHLPLSVSWVYGIIGMYVWQQGGTWFTKRFYGLIIEFFANILCYNYDFKYLIRSEFCTWHDSWAVMACAKFCSDRNIMHLARINFVFMKFGLWAHKSFEKWVPDAGVSFIASIINGGDRRKISATRLTNHVSHSLVTCFTVALSIVNGLQWNFAHAMTAVLLWRVQNHIVMFFRWADIKLELGVYTERHMVKNYGIKIGLSFCGGGICYAPMLCWCVCHVADSRTLWGLGKNAGKMTRGATPVWGAFFGYSHSCTQLPWSWYTYVLDGYF